MEKSETDMMVEFLLPAMDEKAMSLTKSGESTYRFLDGKTQVGFLIAVNITNPTMDDLREAARRFLDSTKNMELDSVPEEFIP